MAEPQRVRRAEEVIRSILEGFADISVEPMPSNRRSAKHDLLIVAASRKSRFRFAVAAKSRITPQTALSIGQQFLPLPKETIPVIFSPTISPRVAEILRNDPRGQTHG